MKLPGDRPLFILLTLLVFVYVALRAALVPIIHDEARTLQVYVITGDWLPFQATWDAGNHLLATGLAQLSYPIFGSGLFALRMWSVLAFLLYAAYAWRLGGPITSRQVRWCFWAAMLATPFLLDFFSLFRGYGLAMAFLLMSVFHASRYADVGSTRDLVLALLAMALASFGSLSLLIMWSTMIGGLGLLTWLRKNTRQQRLVSSVLILLLGVCPLIFATLFSVELARNGALYFGSDLGLYHGTLASLSRYILGTDAALILLLVAALVVGTLFAAFFRSRGLFSSHGGVLITISASLLIADLFGRVVLGKGFGVLYPTDRTAMQLVPLFLILFALVIDRYAMTQPALRSLALILLLLPLRSVMTANHDRTTYWPEQSIPPAFFEFARERQRALDRPLMISAYSQMASCWTYGSLRHGQRLNTPDVEDFPHASCDLLLIDPTFKQPPPGFRTIARAATGHNELMERIAPLRTAVVLDSSFSVAVGDPEFIDLWAPVQPIWLGREMFIDVQAAITSQGPLRSNVIMEVSDGSGSHLAYTQCEIDADRRSWYSDTLRTALRLPAINDSTARVKVYVYNPKRHRFSLDAVRLRVHSLTP